MKLDVPTGTTFYYNPYSPKYYTIVQSPLCNAGSSSYPSSDDEGSFAGSSNSAHSGSLSVEKSRPSDDVYNLGWSTISSVRQEKTTDAAICTMIQRFPFKTLTAMAAVIENSPNLFLELCEKERGNVVAHVISALQGEKCDELVCMATEHARRLALHQSGCIALTRIYDGANHEQQMAIALAMLQHFDELVCHQFGNFVLTRIAQKGDAYIADFLCAQFEVPENLNRALNDKFGSHVFESFIKNCPPNEVFRVCSVIFQDMDQCLSFATSRIANYPLQAALRQMVAVNPNHDLTRWALNTIPSLVADTKFATNINRALGFGRTGADQQVQQPQQQSRRGKAQ